MKKRKPRGIRLKLVFAIMFIFVSIIAVGSTYNNTIQSPERSYEKGDQFEGESIGITYVKLEALEELDIVDKELDEDEKFYMVQHENGFVILKATQKDIKKLIQSSDVPESKIINLKDKNLYSIIDVIEEKGSKGKTNISPELLDKFNAAAEHSTLTKVRILEVIKDLGLDKTKDNYKSKLQEKPFISNVYIKVPGTIYYLGIYGFPAAIVLATLLLIRSIIKGIRKSKAEYEELFIEYPETEYDVDILVRDAKYINKNLRVLIYKDALVFYGGVFNFELLSGFSKITFSDIRDSKDNIQDYTAEIHREFESNEVIKMCSYYKDATAEITELGKILNIKLIKIYPLNIDIQGGLNNNKITIRKFKAKAKNTKFNLDGLFVSGKLSFKEAVEIRKFLNSQDKNLYSLFKNVSIIPCEKGLEITYGNQRYYVKGDN